MTTEAKISVSIKTQNGSILTVRGDDPAEFYQSLQGLQGALGNILTAERTILTGEVDATAAAVAVVQAAIPGSQVINSITGEVTPAPASPVTPAPAALTRTETDRFGNVYTFAHPEAELHQCKHGPRVLKSGRSKAGKQYTAWACKEDAPGGNYKLKCDIEWAS